MLTTNEPGVLITRPASDLAFQIGQAVERVLVADACARRRAKGGGVVDVAEILDSVSGVEFGRVVEELRSNADAASPTRKPG